MIVYMIVCMSSMLSKPQVALNLELKRCNHTYVRAYACTWQYSDFICHVHMIQRSNVVFVHVRCAMIHQQHVLACCVVVNSVLALSQALRSGSSSVTLSASNASSSCSYRSARWGKRGSSTLRSLATAFSDCVLIVVHSSINRGISWMFAGCCKHRHTCVSY